MFTVDDLIKTIHLHLVISIIEKSQEKTGGKALLRQFWSSVGAEKNMKKRILSLILAAAFVFLMMPLFTLPAAAAESVKVKTADELRSALKKDGDMVIELTADITKYKLPNDFKWDGYDEFLDTFFWVTVGKGTKKLYLQGHNVDIDDDFVTTAEYKEVKRYNTETGKEEAVKTLVKGLYIQNAALFRIQEGTTLNIYGKGGGMSMTAQMPSRNQIYDNQITMERDVFFVLGGNLNIEGGTYQAGRRKDIYVANAECFTKDWRWDLLPGSLTGEDLKVFFGYGEYTINGDALAQYGGKVTINGGTFIGHGYGYTGGPSTSSSQVYRQSTLLAYRGDLSIRDAKVIGYSGANAIYIRKEYANVDIYAGEFSAEAPDKFLWPYTQRSSVFGGNSNYSNYKAVAIEPGSTSISSATTHDGTSIKSYDHKTVVFPAESGFTGGSLSWADGSSREKSYAIGSNEFVHFTPPEKYFPEGALERGQRSDYYVSLMYQNSEGKWESASNGWVETEKSFILDNLTDKWKVGTRYRLQMKTVETWSSESHSYQITKKTATPLYFTVSKDKVIDKVTIDGFDPEKRILTQDMLTSSTQGVDYVTSTWSRNGEYESGTIHATSGKYMAAVKVTAKEGYVFSQNTVVDINGVSVKPYLVAVSGKSIQFYTPVIDRECDHENSSEPWLQNGFIHYRKCSICDLTFDAAEHNFTKTSTSGKTTTYTCTVCGYQKEVTDNREAIKALLIDMKALVVGDKLDIPYLAEEYKGKAAIASYQWYKGKGTTDQVENGSVAEEGWYTLKATYTTYNGYYFPEGAFVTHAHGTKAGALVYDDSIIGTVYVYCSEEADGKVVISALTPNKTLGDVLKESTVTRSGDGRINVNYYVKYAGNSYIIKRTFDGKWSVTGGSETVDQVLAKKIVPNTEYEIEFEFSAGKFYVDPKKISVDSKSYMIGYTTDSSDTWGNAKATIISDTDEINLVEIRAVRMPVAGETPDSSCSLYDEERIGLISSYWSETGKYTCGNSYVFTAEVRPVDGYRFTENTVAVVNGVEADLIVSDGMATVILESEILEHSFSDWETKVEPTCDAEGAAERKCSICGKAESMSLPAEGHTFGVYDMTDSTCVDHGMAAHYECHVCGKYFDADYNETTKEKLELPLDPHNHVGGQISCDENSHFTLCECGEKLDVESHRFGEWHVVMEPQPGLEGRRERECEVCGYIHSDKIDALPGEHTHSYTEKYNEKYHWKECICGDIIDKEEHKFGEDGVCSVCGAKKADSAEVTETAPGKTTETLKPGEKGEEGKGSLLWLWIVIGVVVVAAIVVVVVIISKKKKTTT